MLNAIFEPLPNLILNEKKRKIIFFVWFYIFYVFLIENAFYFRFKSMNRKIFHSSYFTILAAVRCGKYIIQSRESCIIVVKCQKLSLKGKFIKHILTHSKFIQLF